ncbi:trans-sulfuration enzyme family protein [Alteromonas lipolytica]|uniref:trans-sulfuration enzyme family protein n=1 Tax=Alteromonas lipolytica TaxID=1856405 RepID=UPI0009F292B5|nr:aminotransferase class I/II-fold pyridoxal phosphate-dependent enzyme [Alteromonas lipolytica]
MKISQQDIDICCGPEPLVAHTDSQPVSQPIHQTSLFSYSSFENLCTALANEYSMPVYTRGRNPSVTSVEKKLAALERGEACKLFASGMGAISAAITGLVNQGEHIIFINQVYSPTIQLAEQLSRFGVTFTYLTSGDPEQLEAAIRPQTRLIWFESPATMTFKRIDISKVVAIAHRHGILTGIDNTWATPLLQKPITLGVDIVAHSLTKYIGGHSDVVAGALISRHAVLKQIFYRTFLLNGAALGPMDAWLIERGLRTLSVRLQQQEASALAIGRFLEGHPKVSRIYHPAWQEDAPPAETNPLAGYNGLISFSLKPADFASVTRFLNALKQFRLGVSWGGFESLAISLQRPENAEQLAAMNLPQGLIRLSVGLEAVQTLINDLEQAFTHV